MTTFFLGLWISIAGFFGLHQDSVVLPEENIATQQPTGNPGQSAPQQTLAICEGKKKDDSCSFTLNEQEHTGICLPSGDRFACTPVLPE